MRRFLIPSVIFVVFLTLFFIPSLSFALPFPPMGSRGWGAGGTYAGLTEDPVAVWISPGGMGVPLNAVQIPIAYRFLDRENFEDSLELAQIISPDDPGLSDPDQLARFRDRLMDLGDDKNGLVSDLAGGVALSINRFGFGFFLRSYTVARATIDEGHLSSANVDDNNSTLNVFNLVTQEYTFGYAHPFSFLSGEGILHTFHFGVAGKIIQSEGSAYEVSLWDPSVAGIDREDLLDLSDRGGTDSDLDLSFDLGMHYSLGDLFHMGLVARNIIAPVIHLPAGETVKMSPQVRIGGDVTLATRLRLSMDYDLTTNDLELNGPGEQLFCLGLEGAAFGLRIRGGFRHDTSGGGGTSYTLGGGYSLPRLTADFGLLFSSGGEELGAGGSLRFLF